MYTSFQTPDPDRPSYFVDMVVIQRSYTIIVLIHGLILSWMPDIDFPLTKNTINQYFDYS